MSRYNFDDFKIAKVDETGDTYYYYLYTKPKAHVMSNTNTFYILRTNVAGTEFKYMFSIGVVDTVWANRATQTYKALNAW